MYSPHIINLRRSRLEEAFKATLPPAGLEGHSVEESLGRAHDLAKVVDKKGRLMRELTAEEHSFIFVERLRSKIDFPYWGRYCTINVAGVGKGPLYPLWRSQELILERIAARELAIHNSGWPDGICANILKARQLGASTLSEAMMTHRITTHANFHVALASDTPETSTNLFDMLERVVDHLPWYMRPRVTDSVKNNELAFDTDSWASILAAKSTRGKEGARGQMGRSFTFGGAHFTELSTWENASQIDDAFEPALAVHPQALWVNESTAKGRGDNWWFTHWHAAKKGKTKREFQNIFIPWYAEPEKYWLPAPVGWTPSEDALVVAKRVEDTGSYWMGRPVTLSREQLYWYQRSREAAIEKDELAKFLEEYPADDEEAFQYSGKSVFSLEVREMMRKVQRPLAHVLEVKPAKEILRV
jgi:hypothetical protein